MEREKTIQIMRALSHSSLAKIQTVETDAAAVKTG
jgi:hypothetical protein